jgi:hypothetical protein
MLSGDPRIEPALLQPIDTAQLVIGRKTVPGGQVNGRQLFFPIDWDSTSAAHHHDLVESPEESYCLLWESGSARKVSVGGDAAETAMMAALVAAD